MKGTASHPPPLSAPSTGGATPGSAATSAPATPSLAVDPYALLDSYDAGRRASSGSVQLDPVAFLNQHYQTESALTHQLGSLREAVSQRMQTLDDRIATALQRQSETAAATRQNVQDAKASITTLTQRIYLVKDKAAQSEQAVQLITKDMKMLDNAKRHLFRTITTLKRLHMLVHAVEELRLVKHKSDYAAASQLVQAIRILNGHFNQYQAKVPALQKLARTVQDLQTELLQQVVQGFRRTALGVEQAGLVEQQEIHNAETKSPDGERRSSVIVEEENTSMLVVMTSDVMKGGVLYLDALGDNVRDDFIQNFCKDLLRPYVEEFSPPKPEAEGKKQTEKRVSSFHVVQQPEPDADEKAKQSKRLLDSVEQRFLWFRGVLEDEMQPKFGAIFPSEWHVQASLARAFLKLTHDHYLTLLQKGPRQDATNATILLKALQKTLVFEKEITAWLQLECQTVFAPEKAGGDKDGNTTQKNRVNPLIGVASIAFDNFMEPYITLEEQSMKEQLVEALEDRTVDNRGERPVFISSTNLFVYIKGSITRCTNLTKGKPFLQLYQAFSESLRKYSQILNGKLPKAISAPSTLPGISIAGLGSKSNTSGTDTSLSESYKIPKGEEVTVCHVISTCEYCTDTVEALEELIRDLIEPKYQGKIDMMADQELFHDLTAKSIRVLVSGLTNRVEDFGLKQMSSMNWGQWESVGEESDYVRVLHQELEPFVTTVRSLLPTSYFRAFCDKFAASFTSTYFETALKLKRISEPGTQQLLLDVYNLKTLFLKLPVLEESKGTTTTALKKPGGGSTIAPAMYTKLVSKQFGKIETLLKLVGTPTDMLIENFKMQWVGGTTADLTTVMTLKQIKRPEQVALLEKFGLDPAKALKGATMGISSTNLMTERVQAVTSDLNNMRQKVDDFRKSFR